MSVATSKQPHVYLDFVDGLRAIAVLSVVLYHAGVPGLRGGFVGVDIFFVISGFLIINQIFDAKRAGKFSFAEFWSRRALRILPPYLLVILSCAAAAPYILAIPQEYSAFAEQAFYSAIMAANHLFLSEEGYFDRGSDTKILLHMWSLAVEEQFYIVAPLVAAVIWRLSRNIANLVVGTLFAASLLGCIAFTGIAGDKNFAFFLMPLRAWEFIAGGVLVALVPAASRLSSNSNQLLAAAGFLALAISITAFSRSTPFPSYAAILPVLGACAIIISGLAGPSAIRTFLSSPVMVAIGLVSYSWYLWHWPALTLARIANFGDRVLWIDLAMVILSLGLAVATYFLVERPIRRFREKWRRPLTWYPTIAGVLVCALVGVFLQSRFSADGARIAKTSAGVLLPKRPSGSGVCDLRLVTSVADCVSQRSNEPIGILIGDSQADAATRTAVELMRAEGAGLLTLASGGCNSLLTARNRIADRQRARNCLEYRQNARRLMPIARPQFAILYSYWSMYADPSTAYYFTDDEGKKLADQRSAFIAQAHATLQYLKDVGVKRILVIGPTPTFPRSAPECVTRSYHYNLEPDTRCSQPVAKENQRRAAAVEWLAAAFANNESVRVIDPIGVFCKDDFCRPYDGRHVLFNDTNHISDAGMRAVYQRFRDEFAWVAK